MAFKGWDKVEISTEEGIVTGIAPIIISASRSTDIPAFHAEWFINRLKKGYIKWINPFNQQVQYVSFAKARIIVFWTKNPKPMIKYLPVIDDMGINYYFTYTLNDYVKEGFEPDVPPLLERINTFKELSQILGKKRVIWRFDPLILTDKLDVDSLLNRIYSLAIELRGYTEKLVVSFVDINSYAKVKRNLEIEGNKCREFDIESIHKIASGLKVIGKEFNLDVATCGENVDLHSYGILKNKCVDDNLMCNLFSDDIQLMDFLGRSREVSLFDEPSSIIDLKDKGQRDACGCIVSKDIGQYNTCLHLCKYCYANYSAKTVNNNFRKIRCKDTESILPR